jgi:hypothetical protein
MNASHVDLSELAQLGWLGEFLTMKPLARRPAKIQPESHLEQSMIKALDRTNNNRTLWVHGEIPGKSGNFPEIGHLRNCRPSLKGFE